MNSHPTITIAELKRQAGEHPLEVRVLAQLQALVRRSTKQGKPYLEVTLADSASRCSLKVWSDTPAYEVLGGVELHAVLAWAALWTQGGFGLEARDLQVMQLGDRELDEFFSGDPALRERQDLDFHTMRELCATMVDPRLRGLCERFFDRFGALMKRTAAARRNHHARRGGLVEHTAQMMRVADVICGVYPQLNRDLLLCGVLFHDAGKLWENSYPERGFAQHVSMRGEMLGHIPMGIEFVNHLWRDVMEQAEPAWAGMQPAAEETRLHLLHLIASHHGELAFGSPVVPRTPEAFALHYIDNLDARLEMVREAYQHAPEIGAGVFERVFPLSSNVVRPLPACEVVVGDETSPDPDAGGGGR